MIDTPRITQTTAQPAAILRLTIPRDKMQTRMGAAMGELAQTVAAQGTPAGPMFAHHLRMDSATFDFELGIPVSGSFAPTGRVVAGELPAARVARTVYHGGFEGLGGAWAELNEWIAANGHTAAPDLWESYVYGPESSPDPATWRTELSRPLVG